MVAGAGMDAGEGLVAGKEPARGPRGEEVSDILLPLDVLLLALLIKSRRVLLAEPATVIPLSSPLQTNLFLSVNTN